MNALKEKHDMIHRIDPDNPEENPERFEELVRLLEEGSDPALKAHLEGFHHSDLADAFGLLPKTLRARVLDALREELDHDLLFELEDHLRHEITDNLSAREVAEVITEMDSDEAVQVLEDMGEKERKEILEEVPDEERGDIEIGLAYPEDSAGRRMQTDFVSVGRNWDVGETIDFLREEVELPEEFFDVFVVDEKEKPIGVISLSRILRSPRPTLMREICDETQVIVPAENYGVKILSIGFFAELDEAVVWRGPMAVKALKQLIFDADWGELDYLIIDTPPGTGDVHLSIVQSLPLTGAVVVTTPQPVALADAKKAVAMLKMDNIKVPVLGLVENMSWFTPKNYPEEKYFIFGEDGGENLAKSLNLELLGKVPIVESIRQSGDVGRPAVLQQETIVEKYYNDLCDKLILNIEERNATLEPTKVVGVEYGDPKCST